MSEKKMAYDAFAMGICCGALCLALLDTVLSSPKAQPGAVRIDGAHFSGPADIHVDENGNVTMVGSRSR